MAQFPHCDPRVLHLPSNCQVCDMFPSLQEARKLWGIAFTDGPAADLPCPSLLRRPKHIIDQWPGNRADVREEVSDKPKLSPPVCWDSIDEDD